MKEKIFKWIGIISAYAVFTAIGMAIIDIEMVSSTRDAVLNYVGFSVGAFGMYILFRGIFKDDPSPKRR